MRKNPDLIQEKPASSLFFFALPMIIGNLFQQFYNMADSVIVGKFVGEDALAAVGASYSFTTIFIMIAIGGGIGASVLTSQYLGAGKYGEMKTSVYTFLITFGVVSILLAAFGMIANPGILRAQMCIRDRCGRAGGCQIKRKKKHNAFSYRDGQTCPSGRLDEYSPCSEGYVPPTSREMLFL